jgi:uncharacterized phage-associated protein
MAHSPITVANTLLRIGWERGEGTTPLKLVKLTYLAHGWHLASQHAPLLNYRVEAWKYGPVVPPLYYEARRFGRDAITSLLDVDSNPYLADGDTPQVIPSDDVAALEVCAFVWDAYGHYSGGQLSNLTHQPGTPWWTVWHEQRGKDRMHAEIPDDLIREHYEDVARRANALEANELVPA